MAKVEPVDPTQKTGDGKSFLERMERGLSNDPKANPEKAKEFADRLEKYVNEGKEAEAKRNAYTKNYSGQDRGGGGGGAGIPKVGPKKPTEMKKGGKVSASSRADGCAVRGKTRGKMV